MVEQYRRSCWEYRRGWQPGRTAGSTGGLQDVFEWLSCTGPLSACTHTLNFLAFQSSEHSHHAHQSGRCGGRCAAGAFASTGSF